MPLRNAATTVVRAAVACAVLAAIATDAGHAGPGPVPGAGRAALPVSAATSAAAATAPESAPPTLGPQTLGPQTLALGSAPGRLVVPDLVASVPGGLTAAQVTRIATLSGVRAVLPVDGGQVTVNGKPASVLGVSPQAFRSWAPPQTAAADGIWIGLASGDLVASQAAGGRLGLVPGNAAELAGGTAVLTTVAAAAQLGLPGVDAVVSAQRGAQLGLAANVAVLINAPGADLATLMQQVRAVTGPAGRVVNLVRVVTTVPLPVTTTVPAGVPGNYLTLYQASAAEYCPGLSWTVLAAIGQIESGHGTNEGPSSAGALGPMQFLPSTWAEWGIDGFGQTGTPDIMNPLDAVPSAARMLCAGGAASSTSLASAIYGYNHATWYVNEVLALAREYAQEYP